LLAKLAFEVTNFTEIVAATVIAVEEFKLYFRKSVVFTVILIIKQ
jgi:hypothetical protein